MLKPEKLNALSHKLGHDFRDSTPLMTALTHRSFIHERPSHVYPTNERMEFLGDAILALVVAEELMRTTISGLLLTILMATPALADTDGISTKETALPEPPAVVRTRLATGWDVRPPHG